jgi:hypothetical protein
LLPVIVKHPKLDHKLGVCGQAKPGIPWTDHLSAVGLSLRARN